MKITSIDIIMLPLRVMPGAKPILVRVNTDEGIYGYGEAGATFILGSDSAFAMLKEMSKLIIGMDPLQNEVIWDTLYSKSYWTKGNGAIIFSGVSALDTALWDIRGKALGKPVCELLGGKFRDSVRCYASQLQFGFYDHVVPQRTLEDYRTVCQVAMEKGYDAIKVDLLKYPETSDARVGEDENFGHFTTRTLQLIEDRLRVVRETVGPDCDIILEQHGGTTLNTAIQVAKIAEPFNIMYMEEPLAPLNPQLTKILSEKTSIPLTSGERSYLRQGFLPFFQDRSLAMVQPDLGICGGITEGKKIADMAYVYDIGVQAHVCGTPISVAAGLHLEASIPNFTIHETHMASVCPEMTRFGTVDFTPVNGQLTIPTSPGLGVELTEEALACAIIETIK